MIIRERHIVEGVADSIRLEAYCLGLFSGIGTRKGVKKAISRGEVLLNKNEKRASDFVKKGDVIEWVEKELATSFKVFPMELEILYEDEFFAIVHKPAGYPVSGNYFKTIEHALPYNLDRSKEHDALKYPLPCHRLDSSTSGCLIVAKTHNARVEIGNQFEQLLVKKEYHAIVVGDKASSKDVRTPIEDKPAHTTIHVLESFPSLTNDKVSLVKLIPHTGRTHQLRIHCASSGFPILGDALHGTPKALLKGKGLFLAATHISFKHPATHEAFSFELPIPKKFRAFLEREAKRFEMFLK